VSNLQLGFILFTFLGPLLLWLLSRRVRSRRLAAGISTTLALLLLGAYLTAFILKVLRDGEVRVDETLPMHLCDWAAIATTIALLRRSPLAFELAYCWGLAGTLQGLFTPAITIDLSARSITFLLVHSLIPAGVFWLMGEYRLRPRPGAYLRVMLWSQVFLGLALFVNWVVDGNYGFLSERPPNPSLLDHYSDTRWIYVLQIDLTAAVAFAILILPWVLLRRYKSHTSSTTAGCGIPDA
jgi:hypothetical integral membrane protein (TIGR02206 family)